jgi:glyoxylase-like metal-dependent hydrolase (beta-lactamase superfamily II)
MRLAALLLVSLATAAGAAEPAPKQFTATPLGGSVSVLQGWECNNPVSAGEDGIVLVDTCGAKVAERLLAAAQRLSPKPLRFVINTHAHGDHTDGNAVVQKVAPIIAHHNVRTRMAAGNEKTRDKPAAPEALPIVTFDSEMILHLNGEEIRLLHVPPAHTDGDTVVFFKNANVVCMGDVFTPAASFADRWYGGSMLGLIQALELVLPQIPADAKIVPGHGVVSTRADVERGLEVLKGMKEVVEAGVRSGKSLEQLQAERPFDQWRSSVPKWSSSDKSLDGWVKDFYREIAK